MYYSYSTKKETTAIEGKLVEFKKSDKIFTTFAYVSSIDIKKDLLKRDVYLGFYHLKDSNDIKPVPVGSCEHEYEVGLGYQDINGLITENIDRVCNEQNANLPEPIILSVNPTSSMNYGKYSRGECDQWITARQGKRRCEPLIKQQLIKDGNWKKIADKSKAILSSYIKIYCD
jgi:hypothetical protein